MKKGTRAAFEVDDDGEGIITLPCWAGFRQGGDAEPSDGQVLLTVGGDNVDKKIRPAHEAAYRFALERAARVQVVVLDALVAELPRLTAGFAAGTAPAADLDALRDMVTLVGVHLHHAERGGVAYVGYELGCAWDREHGLGVMTHRERVVEVGQADTSLLGWIAEQDRDGTLGTAAREPARAPIVRKPKPAPGAEAAKPGAAAKSAKPAAAKSATTVRKRPAR